MARETVDLHEKELHTGLYTAAALAAGLALAGAALYASKGRAAEALPEAEGMFSFRSGWKLFGERAANPRTIEDTVAELRYLSGETSPVRLDGLRAVRELFPEPSGVHQSSMLEQVRIPGLAHQGRAETSIVLRDVLEKDVSAETRIGKGSPLTLDVDVVTPKSARLNVAGSTVSGGPDSPIKTTLDLYDLLPVGRTKLRLSMGQLPTILELPSEFRPIISKNGVAALSDEAMRLGDYTAAHPGTPLSPALRIKRGYAAISPYARLETGFRRLGNSPLLEELGIASVR